MAETVTEDRTVRKAMALGRSGKSAANVVWRARSAIAARVVFGQNDSIIWGSAMIRTALALAALIAATSASAAPCRDDHGRFIKCPVVEPHHPVCRIGKPCGNSCISKDKVCHKR